MDEFKKAINSQGFNYVYERELTPKEERIVKMPPISANKRGINDIGWQANGDVTLWGTLASRPDKEELWQEINDYDEVNKTVTAIKIVNNEDKKCRIVIRAILC